MHLAIRSRRVVTPTATRPATVIVNAGRISSVTEYASAPGTGEVFDAEDRMVLPGLVDSHVHANEPGRTEWEGFATATRAAAAGGFTTIVDMPLNCLPATTTVAALDEKRRAATGRCWTDYAFWAGLVQDNREHLTALAEAGVRGYKCFLVPPGIDGFTMVTEAQLEGAMPLIAAAKLPLLTHAELPGPLEAAGRNLDAAAADRRKYATYLGSRPDEAELAAVRQMIRLSEHYGCRVHIVHLSSCQALGDLRSARQKGLKITVETCPHYLHLVAEKISDGATQYKCAPPVRGCENRERLWAALEGGVIDLIATDHSPCPPAMKRGNFFEAWGGIASISMALPVIWTEARRRGIEINDVVRWMAERPAELAGLSTRKGRIEPGFDADLVVFDPDAAFRVEAGGLYYRHPISPYLGETLEGRVEMTLVRGQKVFAHGQFAADAPGKECTPT